jgi:hypothetical protein
MAIARRSGLAALTLSLLLPAAVGCGHDGAGPGGGGQGGGTGGGATGGAAAAPECAAPGSEAALLAEAKQAIDDAGAGRRGAWQAIFGLAADGTLAAGGLGPIDWDPSHDSVYFTSLDVERNVPLLISNDAAQAPSSAHVTLGLGADTGTWKYALLGANAPSDLALSPPAPGSAAARMDDFVVRLLGWLTGKDPGDGAGMKVVLAHLADTYWFRHDTGTAQFFAARLPQAKVNAEDACEGAALAGCLAGASLLVLSDEDGSDDENHVVPADRDAVLAAVDLAEQKGIPVLYLQYDGSLTPLGERLMARFRVRTTDNYWNVERLTGFSATALPTQKDELSALQSLVETAAGSTLSVGDYQACLGQKSRFADCDAPAFVDKIGRGAAVLQASMNGLDEAAENPYAGGGFHLLRTLGRLGVTYRAGAAVAFPVDFPADPQAFTRAIVADAAVHYTQRCNRPQADLGTFVCEREDVLAHTCKPYDPAAVPRGDGSVTEAFRPGAEWTSTGLYALPGVPLTVKRTDGGAGAVSVRFNFQREGTTRSLETDGDGSRYDRPAYLASPWIPVAAGKELTLTSPYGGPLYVWLGGTPALAGQEVALSFTGVAHHAALLDVGDAAKVASFVADVAGNPLPHVDVRGAGFEVHLRKDRLLAGVTAPYSLVSHGDGTPVTVDYHGDLGLLLADFRDNYLAPEYRLAGFAPPGSTLQQSLSADVQAICGHLGWSCTDPAVHARTTIQHASYDQYAACGDGCSGNPFDADWPITPLGWGESHELGHNLQMGPLQIGYVAAADRNDWSKYQGRATENSNNVFPYHNLWRWLRTVQGEAGTVVDDHMNLKTLYAMVQSSRAGLTRTVNGQMRRVVFDEACNLVGDYPPAATEVHAEAIWQDPGYAATNGPRMGFYLQLPLRLQGKKMGEGTTLGDGFDVFTLLYAEARLFLRAAGDDAAWSAARDGLGFGMFPRSGEATYGGLGVDQIPGNDFLLVSLSYLSGLDFRTYFQDLGVRYSDLAAAQVDAHVAAGQVTGALPSALVVLETDLPGADLTTLATVAPDGAAAWPRDGFHPKSCP